MTDQGDPLARIAAALERLAPPLLDAADWLSDPAYVWDGAARAVTRIAAPPLALLKGIDAQKDAVTANVARLAAGHAAHDMLLWGARGMGKSALLRASVIAAQQADPSAIALVQIAPEALASLTGLFAQLGTSSMRRFLVFIDDLGFEDADSTGLARAALVAGRRGRGAPCQRPPGRHLQPPCDRAAPPVGTG